MRFLRLHFPLILVVFAFQADSLTAASVLPLAIQGGIEAQYKDHSFDGGGFSFHYPAKHSVSEMSNGQVFFTELRHREVTENEAMPVIKMMLIPGAAGQLAIPAFMDMLQSEVQNFANSTSATMKVDGEAKRIIAGEERVGRKLVLESQAPLSAHEIFGFEWNGDLIGILCKAYFNNETQMKSVWDTVLKDLEIKTLTAQSVRRVVLGKFYFDVPAMTQEGRSENQDALTLQLGYPEGVINLMFQQLPSRKELLEVKGSFFRTRANEVEHAIVSAKGKYLGRNWTGLWAQDGILNGSRMNLMLPDGRPLHSYSYLLPVADFALLANFDAMPETRDALIRHLTQLVSTLGSPDHDADLKAAFGLAASCHDLGLRFSFPNSLHLIHRKEGGTRRVLFTGGIQFIFDVQENLLAEDGLLEWLTATVLEAYPGAKIGATWAIEGPVFGVKQVGAALSFTTNEIEYQINALPGPHRGGTVITAATCPTPDAAPILWIFANLHGGLIEIPDGPRNIASKDVQLTFDPAEWALETNTTSIGNQFKFESRVHSAVVRLEVERWRVCLATDDFQKLTQRALNARISRRASAYIELDKGFLREELFIHSDSSKVEELSNATAVRNTLTVGVPEEEEWEMITWTLRLADAVVKIRSRTLLEDADAQQAVNEMIASIVLQNVQKFPDQH
ncbi:MAG: hypothetical protein HQ519_01590 [Planctomycetes bacterium]|nr:hypothetical protein [Planctomycetota bacterium]